MYGLVVSHQHALVVEFKVLAEALVPSLTEVEVLEVDPRFYLKYTT